MNSKRDKMILKGGHMIDKYYEWQLKIISERIKNLDKEIRGLSAKYGNAYWTERFYNVTMPEDQHCEDYFLLLDCAVSERGNLKNKLERFLSLIQGQKVEISDDKLETKVNECLVETPVFEDYMARDGYQFYSEKKERLSRGELW